MTVCIHDQIIERIIAFRIKLAVTQSAYWAERDTSICFISLANDI